MLASSAAAAPPHPMGGAIPHHMAAAPHPMAAAAGPVGHHPVVGAHLPPLVAGDDNIRFLIEQGILTEEDITNLLSESPDVQRLLLAARIARDPQIWPQLRDNYIGFFYIHRRATPGLADAQIIQDVIREANE